MNDRRRWYAKFSARHLCKTFKFGHPSIFADDEYGSETRNRKYRRCLREYGGPIHAGLRTHRAKSDE